MERIACFGDSITYGHEFSVGHSWPAHLNRQLELLFPGRFEIENRGIGGDTTIQALDRIDYVLSTRPKWVFIQFGLNDCSVRPGRKIPRCGLATYQENLAEIIRIIRVHKGNPILLTNHPIGSGMAKSAQGNGRDYILNFKPYQPAIRAVAKKCKVPLIDLEAVMLKAKIKATDIVRADKVHLKQEANPLYARLVLDGFMGIHPELKKLRGKK
ncbi:MAG: SGNH/GDSL hydrolase family protein [Chthoniobacterales bacterium]